METRNHECYVDLEVAKLLKEAGFKWKCKNLYDSQDHYNGITVTPSHENWNVSNKLDYSAPTLEVAQRWLREVKHLDISIHYDPTIKTQPYAYVIYDADEKFNDIHGMISPVTHSDSYGYFYAYEEAQESGIKEALEIILKKGEYENN